jgi:regulator of sirC expression with transglutaminase-like and TPR domain
MKKETCLMIQFEEAVSCQESEMDVAKAALLIAKSEYPALDVPRYLKRLDEMAAVVDGRLGSHPSLIQVITEINRFLFEEQGFLGNSLDYFDPRNSFLNDVLERKLGVPISLSLIYIEIGQRLGIPFAGVSFPGHFLVKLSVPAGEIVLDPFYGGLSLTKEDLEIRLRQIIPDENWSMLDFSRLLAGANKREILTRMLRNLKTSYIRSGDYKRALGIVQKVLILRPDDPNEIRDRGYIFERLDCFRASADDYGRYLEMSSSAEDAALVRTHYQAMHLASSRLN